MAADYAAAVEAIKDWLDDNWSTTPIALQNEAPPETPWPPLDVGGALKAWVLLEVVGNGSAQRAVGMPGGQFFLTLGHVLVHVFVPLLDGSGDAVQYAVTIGEIFRQKVVMRDEAASAELRTTAPWVDGGSKDPENGAYFRVTMTVPFEFYHRG